MIIKPRICRCCCIFLYVMSYLFQLNRSIFLKQPRVYLVFTVFVDLNVVSLFLLMYFIQFYNDVVGYASLLRVNLIAVVLFIPWLLLFSESNLCHPHHPFLRIYPELLGVAVFSCVLYRPHRTKYFLDRTWHLYVVLTANLNITLSLLFWIRFVLCLRLIVTSLNFFFAIPVAYLIY